MHCSQRAIAVIVAHSDSALRSDIVTLGLSVKRFTPANINTRVGPNGNVYPCQSYFESFGNVFTTDWGKIWKDSLAVKIREREYAEPKCKDCPQLQVCRGGCR